MALGSARKVLGELPGEKKIVVNSAIGPSAYVKGTGVQVRMDVKTLGSRYDIIGVHLQGPPRYAYSVGGWAGNVVNVLLGCPQNVASGVTQLSCFVEISAGADFCDVSVFVAAMGR